MRWNGERPTPGGRSARVAKSVDFGVQRLRFEGHVTSLNSFSSSVKCRHLVVGRIRRNKACKEFNKCGPDTFIKLKSS